MTKKINSLENLGELVYSTHQNTSSNQSSDELSTPQSQRLEAHFSNKGRGGKTVTVIKGFVGVDEELKKLSKLLKVKLSVGGSIKDGDIIIQGDYRDKIIALLIEQGHKIKRVGG